MRRLTRRYWWLVAVAIVAAVGSGLWRYCGVHMPAAATKAAAAGQLYQCPMHPSYTSDKPGDCSICGMSLVPVKKGESATTAAATDTGSKVEGQATVYLSPEKQQLIGLRTEAAQLTPVTKGIRAVGQITADEARLQRVYSKVGGWVEKLYVDFTGKAVRKGEPLLSIYSPDLVATQEEYLIALKARKRLANSSFPEISGSSEDLVAASRRRLQLWDIPESEIRRIEKAGEPIRALTLYSPASGYVMEKSVLEGQRIEPTTPLLAVANLSEVCVQAEFYEQDLGSVRVGDHAQVTVSAYPGRTWHGVIDYVLPSVDPQTRTLRARLHVANGDDTLKPGMYADVLITKSLGTQLTVPEDTVIDSGTRQIVFVARPDGHFEARQVSVGERANGRQQVLSGVQAGERVVTNGNFLVDSESRLKSALEDMAAPESGESRAEGSGNREVKGPSRGSPGKSDGSMPPMPGM